MASRSVSAPRPIDEMKDGRSSPAQQPPTGESGAIRHAPVSVKLSLDIHGREEALGWRTMPPQLGVAAPMRARGHGLRYR